MGFLWVGDSGQGFKALQISRNELDCQTYAPEKKTIFRKFIKGHYRAAICKSE